MTTWTSTIALSVVLELILLTGGCRKKEAESQPSKVSSHAEESVAGAKASHSSKAPGEVENDAGNLDILWERTPKIDYEKFVVEYISKGPAGQPDISKKQETTPFVKKEIPAFVIEGEFYGDLAWLERSPTAIDHGLTMTVESTGGFMHGEGTYGKVYIKSNSVFTMKPISPDNAGSTSVKISGKVECLFHPGSLGRGSAFLPLFFVDGTKAMLLLMKGERITYKGTSILAEEDTEIEFTFDAKGNAKSSVTKGKIRKL